MTPRQQAKIVARLKAEGRYRVRPYHSQRPWWFVVDVDGSLCLPCRCRVEAVALAGKIRRVVCARLVVMP